jgi:ABC-type phosphate transport system substrate-binding protein
MKLKTLAAACAMAFAGQAFALSPVTYPVTAATQQIFFAGSSALQNALGETAQDLFVNGAAGSSTATDEFFDGTATKASGSNFRAYYGVLKSTGAKAVIYHTAKGGSIYGVNPVALGTTVARLDLTTCGTASITTDSKTSLPVWSCTGSVLAVPDAGISDVEPAVLEQPANITKIAGVIPADIGGPLTTAQLGNLASTVAVGQVFGVVVNTSVASTSKIANLSKAQVAALFTGTIADWNTIDSTIPAGSTTLVVCRRQSGSGSQAALNAVILGNPCQTGEAAPLGYTATTATLGSTTAAAAGTEVVIENSSTGALAACLTYAQSGTPAGQAIDVTTGGLVTAGAANSVVLSATPKANYAIGIIGLDHGVGSDLYQNVTLNGIAPSLANAQLGQYDLVVESTFQIRSGLSGAVAGTVLPSAGATALYNLVLADVQNPAILGGSIGAVVPGLLGLSENGYAPTTLGSFSASFPVLQVGNFGNTCAPFQQLQ